MTSAVEGKGGGRDMKSESGMKIGQVKHIKKKCRKKAGKLRPLVQASKRCSPVKGELKPTSEGSFTKEPAISAQGGSIPAQREVASIQKGASLKDEGATPALGGAKPVQGGGILGHGGPIPGGEIKRNKKKCKKKAGKLRPLVQLPKHKLSPVKGGIKPASEGAFTKELGISTQEATPFVQEGAIPVQRDVAPAQGGAIHDNGGAIFALGVANLSQGGVIGAKSEAVLGQGGPIPGGIKRNKKKCKKKVGKVRPLVEVSRRGYGPTESGAIPAQGGAIPAQGGAIPAQGGAIPAQGGTIPTQGRTIATEKRAIPALGGVIPTQRGAIPAQEGAISAKVIAMPTHGEAISASVAAKSVQGGAIPSKVGFKPEKKSSVTQKGKRDSVTQVSGKNLSLKRKKLKNSKDQMTLEGDLLEEYLRRVEKRNERTLYVKVPSPVDINNTKILSPLFDDAASTRFPQHKMYGYCYIEYESQEKAEKMKPILEEIEILGRRCEVDFVGVKSKNYIPPKVLCVYPKELFLDGLPPDTTYEDLRSAFNTAQIIQTKKFLKKGNAYIKYKRKEEAEKVFREQGGLRINGREVMVLYVKACPSEQSTDPEAKRRKGDDTAKRKQDLKDL
ncbi:zonadhesin-like [Penaeus monodon]|uniref:zonadhesin-like n=1 Tax=Penaeus monodon TaxID=6687 RepID=UPI0018A75BD8|nr:zonadhesin-like [Penaeus monodon]XP_037785270.1 zonadhesin-like [Penaeus monodon]